MKNIKLKEVLRYIGYNQENVDDETLCNIEQAYRELEKAINYKVTYKVFNVTKTDEGITLKDTTLTMASKSLNRLLKDCERCIVICVTLGQGTDMLLRKIQVEDMSKAIIYDACANSMLETFADEYEDKLKKDYEYFTERFGVGYGDLPLEINLPLSQILNLNRTVGVSISSSHLMVPSKSILAIIGIADRPQKMFVKGCKHCDLKECQYRKTGGCCSE